MSTVMVTAQNTWSHVGSCDEGLGARGLWLKLYSVLLGSRQGQLTNSEGSGVLTIRCLVSFTFTADRRPHKLNLAIDTAKQWYSPDGHRRSR